MKGKFYILACMGALLLWPAASFGRIGEGARELAVRYGAPVATNQVQNFVRCKYDKSGFEVTVYFENDRSVLETFCKRGLAQSEATELVNRVAGQAAPVLAGEGEAEMRKASGITCKDELFWSWAAGAPPVSYGAAFNPVECQVAFFADPATYARVDQALSATSIAGS